MNASIILVEARYPISTRTRPSLSAINHLCRRIVITEWGDPQLLFWTTGVTGELGARPSPPPLCDCGGGSVAYMCGHLTLSLYLPVNVLFSFVSLYWNRFTCGRASCQCLTSYISLTVSFLCFPTSDRFMAPSNFGHPHVVHAFTT